MKDLEQFKLEVSDGIATVVFDRPPVNAQNRQSREEFIQLFDALSDRDDVRVAILTGTGLSARLVTSEELAVTVVIGVSSGPPRRGALE